MRAKFHCEAGYTNVWREPAVRGNERFKTGAKCIHTNQKPLKLTELLIRLSSDPGDMVWEPFGGLCTAAVAAERLGRRAVSAEINKEFFQVAAARLEACNGR
jgi:site-specific DNA-methyltransferase (adenine-specific)